MATDPKSEAMVKEAKPMPWADAREVISTSRTHWLTTVRPDGSPHVVPVGSVWHDGAYYFITGQNTVKERNVKANARCTISCAGEAHEVVVEGVASRETDQSTIEKLAEIYAGHGWPATAVDGALDAPFGPLTGGPPPYNVYLVTPTKAFAFGTTEDTAPRSTRYRF